MEAGGEGVERHDFLATARRFPFHKMRAKVLRVLPSGRTVPHIQGFFNISEVKARKSEGEPDGNSRLAQDHRKLVELKEQNEASVIIRGR